jgi:heat shock protein HslJ
MSARPLIGLVLSAVLSLTGCAAATPSAPPSSAPSSSPASSAGAAVDLVGQTWTVTSIAGKDTVATRPTMAFRADGRVEGTGSCNSYGGPYQVDGDAIDVGDLASTMMLCADEAIAAQETAFFGALGGAQTWRIEEAGKLVLEGTSRIVAEAGPAGASGSPEAVGLVGAWNLAEMGPTADFAHLQPTIEFRADGTMSGFAGCNTFNGSYTTDGAALTFGPVATTKMACERPGSAVEADYLNALAGVTGWAVEPDGRLRLDGAVPLRYTRAS